MNTVLPHELPAPPIDPETALRRTDLIIQALGSVASGGDVNEAYLMAQWTGSEHANTGVGAVGNRDTIAAMPESWRLLLEGMVTPERGALVGSPDVTLVVGASGDIMYQHARTLEDARRLYRPGEIWYLAGMRPAGTDGDKRLAAHMGIDFGQGTYTETDLARNVIQRVHHGRLQQTSNESSTVNEQVNELGPRTWTHEYYETPDGRRIVLLNGAAVARRGGGAPRNTSESVFQEVLDTARLPEGVPTIDVMATYPHTDRIALELYMQLLSREMNAKVEAISVMPPVDRITPEGVLSAVMPLRRVSREVIELGIRQSRLPIMRAAENHESAGRLPAVMSAIRARAIAALAQIAPPTFASESLGLEPTLESYLMGVLGPLTALRREADEPLFANASAKESFTRLMLQLGVNEAETIGPDRLGIGGRPYLFFGEGGTIPKMDLELAMAADAQHKPAMIVLGASKDRAVTNPQERANAARLLGVDESEVGQNEYELGRQLLAHRQVVRRPAQSGVRLSINLEDYTIAPTPEGVESDIEFMGYDAQDAPVFMLNAKRQPIPGSEEYRSLSPAGSYEALVGMLTEPQVSRLFTDAEVPSVVCMGSSTLYAPTRLLGLLEAREKLATNADARAMPHLALALYGRGEAARKIWYEQMSSELRHVLRRVQSWEASSPASDASAAE